MRWGALLGAVLLAAACDGGTGEPERAAAEPGALAGIGRPVEGGAVHLVRLVARQGERGFEPAEVRVRAGDVVRFVLAGRLPESVAFDTAPAPPGGAEFLRRRDAVHGVLMTGPGQVYDVSFEGAPAGRYHFRSVAHPGGGMRGAVVVE